MEERLALIRLARTAKPAWLSDNQNVLRRYVLGQIALSAVPASRANRADDGWISLGNLIGNLASMDVDMTGKLERQPDSLTFDRGDFDDAVRVAGIPDDDLFPFSSGNDKHELDLLPIRSRDLARSHHDVGYTNSLAQSATLASFRVKSGYDA